MSIVRLLINIDNSLNEEKVHFETNGFCINDKCIVASHEGLPIKSVFLIVDGDLTELKVIIDSQWNELLFLEKPENVIFKPFLAAKSLKEDYSSFSCDKSLHYSKLDVNGIEFISINNIDNFEIPYINCKKTNQDSSTMIGQPVYAEKNDKKYMIGIISYISSSNLNNNNNETIYVLPYYIIFKTLNKIDNDNIYFINNKQDNITKIGKFLVNDNTIYNSSLKIPIPLESFMLIEGDEEKELSVNHKLSKMEKTDTILKMNTHLQFKKRNYTITFRLLNLIKIVIPKKCKEIFEKFRLNPEKTQKI